MNGPSVLLAVLAGLQAPDAVARKALRATRSTLDAEAPLGGRESPATSWRCVGDGVNRSCLFKNLYYTRMPSGLSQFVMLLPKGGANGTERVWVQRADKYEYAWRPEVREFDTLEAISDYLGSKHVLEQKGLSLQFNPLFHQNIGHALFDGLYPAYMALLKLGIQDKPFRPVVAVTADCFDEPGKGGPLELGDVVEAYLPHPQYNRTLQPSHVEITQVSEKTRSLDESEDAASLCTFETGFDSSAMELGSQPLSPGTEGQSECCKACDQTFGCTRAVIFANICYLKGKCQGGTAARPQGPSDQCDTPREDRLLCRFHEDRRPPPADVTVRPVGQQSGAALAEVTIPETWVLGRVRRRCMSEGVFQTFGRSGQMLRLFEMDRDVRANPDAIFRFDEIAIGSGGAGNMIQDSSGAIGGSQAPLNAMARFRDRMLQAYGLPVESKPAQEKESRRPLDVIVVSNKRFHTSDVESLSAFVNALNQQDKVNASFVDWGAIGTGETKFRDHLRRVQQADVYVSSIGTALQYVPFLKDRRVYMALGSVWQRSEQLFPTFMEQQLAGGGTPYLRTLYADPGAALRQAQAFPFLGEDGFRAEVNASFLLGLFGQAESLVRQGFKIPVPVEDNLSAEARLLVELCRQDPASCASMQEDRNGAAYDCGLVLWPECVVYEVGPWREKCRLNRPLLRKLRKDRGLFAYGAPEV